MTEARSEVEQAVLRAGEVCGVECGARKQCMPVYLYSSVRDVEIPLGVASV